VPITRIPFEHWKSASSRDGLEWKNIYDMPVLEIYDMPVLKIYDTKEKNESAGQITQKWRKGTTQKAMHALAKSPAIHACI
jgi:hypothetical protein